MCPAADLMGAPLPAPYDAAHGFVWPWRLAAGALALPLPPLRQLADRSRCDDEGGDRAASQLSPPPRSNCSARPYVFSGRINAGATWREKTGRIFALLTGFSLSDFRRAADDP